MFDSARWADEAVVTAAEADRLMMLAKAMQASCVARLEFFI
jgi:hypothetical protein